MIEQVFLGEIRPILTRVGVIFDGRVPDAQMLNQHGDLIRDFARTTARLRIMDHYGALGPVEAGSREKVSPRYFLDAWQDWTTPDTDLTAPWCAWLSLWLWTWGSAIETPLDVGDGKVSTDDLVDAWNALRSPDPSPEMLYALRLARRLYRLVGTRPRLDAGLPQRTVSAEERAAAGKPITDRAPAAPRLPVDDLFAEAQ